MGVNPLARPKPPKAKRKYRVSKKQARNSIIERVKLMEYIEKGIQIGIIMD